YARNAMWPSPAMAERLSYDVNTLALGSGQTIGAYLIMLWVSIVIGMLGAFAISFYFSANTVIYYLMRHEVDATELDDVYLEQSDEEFPADAATTTTTTSTTTVVTPTGTITTSSEGAAGDNPPSAGPSGT